MKGAELREAIDLMRQFLKDDGPCDHAAGLCNCGIVSWIAFCEEVLAAGRAIPENQADEIRKLLADIEEYEYD